jgi:hypothetical protein
LTDERDGRDRRDDSRADDAAESRRPYAAPELIEYGTVAKLTQTGSGSVFDFTGMRMMMVCL